MEFLRQYGYYITIAMQVLCGIHCYNRGKTGWLWIIIFFPIVGCLIYFFMEILPTRRMNAPKIDVGAIVNPGGKIKKLEETLRFTDTFQNRMHLADAYLASGQTEKAVELYENSLTGAFIENEHALAQLVIAYYWLERFDDAIQAANKIYKLPQFIRSQAHLFYALSLENLGETEKADAEFKRMIGRYSYYEQRYQYGMFLTRADRNEEAAKIFTTMLEEETQLSAIERKSAKVWCANARAELKNIA